MSRLSIIFDKPKRTSLQVVEENGDETPYLIFDMTKSISHQNVADPTEEPIENASIVGDHIDVRPKVVTFEGIMSEAPITIGQALLGNFAGAVPAIGGFGNTLGGTLFTGIAATLGGNLLNSSENRLEKALNAMLDLQQKKIIVTLVTGLRAYNNMVLQSFTPIEEPTTGNSLIFTATFKEIQIVQSESVILPASVVDPDVANKAPSLQKRGKKVTKETTRGSSFLATALGGGA